MKSIASQLSILSLGIALILSSCKKEPIQDPIPTPEEVPNQSGKIKSITYDDDPKYVKKFGYDGQGRVKTVEFDGVNSNYIYDNSEVVRIRHFIVGDQEYVYEDILLNSMGYAKFDKNGGMLEYNADGTMSKSLPISQPVVYYTWGNGDLLKQESIDTVPFDGDTLNVLVTTYSYEHISNLESRNKVDNFYGVDSKHPVSKIILSTTSWNLYPNGSQSAHQTDSDTYATFDYTFDEKGRVKTVIRNDIFQGTSKFEYSYYE